MFEAMLSAVAAFAGTNIDDIFILMLLFAQCGDRADRWRVTAGQYLGIGVLTAVSMLCALGLGQVPEQYLRLLGLVPILLGVRAWLRRKEEETAEAKGSGVLSTAALTIANGADNIGVYIPLFAGFTGTQLAVTAAVFATMTGLWCLLGAKLADLPRVQAVIGRWKSVLVPAVLILLGLSIILSV